MDLDAPNTKTALVLAAGELFAEHGFEGVSTRMIAEKAGVNLGGIHYHFGTKEALYVAAFKYVCERDERPSLSHILEERPELGRSPEGLAEAILITCRSFLGSLFDPERPQWRVRLILRELSNPSAALPILVEEVFRTDLESDMDLYRRLRPGTTEDEALIWGALMKSQAIFFLMAKAPFTMMRDGRPLDEAFLDRLVRFTAGVMIAWAGLPMPASLKKDRPAMVSMP